jgi:hypothetical protein
MSNISRKELSVINEWLDFLKKENEYAITEITAIKKLSHDCNNVTFDIYYIDDNSPQRVVATKERYEEILHGVQLCKTVRENKAKRLTKVYK